MNSQEAPQNPGSIHSFAEANGIENLEEAARLHSKLVTEYRVGLAAMHGVDLETLHDMKFDA